MSQPTPYSPLTEFLSYQGATPAFPGQQLDAEFNNLATSIGAIDTNLKLIQRDDGALANGSVNYQTLSPALQAAGLQPLSAWVTGKTYYPTQSIIFSSALYLCNTQHVSGVFATDLAAGDWTLLTQLSLLSSANVANANLVAAGPVSGAAASPTFRSLVLADLPIVNTNIGAFGSSTAIPVFTVNAAGLLTAASTSAVVAPAGTLTGTTLAANVVTSSLTSVALNAITNAMAAQAAAYTFKGNPTGALANVADFTPTSLTNKAVPVGADVVILADSAASNALKYATLTQLISAIVSGVSSYNTRTGAIVALATDIPLNGYISGLTLSTAGSSATFGVALGVATDSTFAAMMSLGSAYTKTTAAWAVGSTNGSFDGTGTAPSTNGTAGWYHVFLIKRPDTGVVDVLTSNSATSPTLPTNYTLSRRIGAMKVDGGSPPKWVKFSQFGNEFLWDVPTHDANLLTPSATTAQTLTLNVPTGVQVLAKLTISANWSSGAAAYLYVSSFDSADTAASATVGDLFSATTTPVTYSSKSVRTNTSAAIRWRMSTTTTLFDAVNSGWIDNL